MMKKEYLTALAKLSMPFEMLYDENGIVRQEYFLTAKEKEALMYYVGTDAYYKKDELEADQSPEKSEDNEVSLKKLF